MLRWVLLLAFALPALVAESDAVWAADSMPESPALPMPVEMEESETQDLASRAEAAGDVPPHQATASLSDTCPVAPAWPPPVRPPRA